jgi:hypothetical protein
VVALVATKKAMTWKATVVVLAAVAVYGLLFYYAVVAVLVVVTATKINYIKELQFAALFLF